MPAAEVFMLAAAWAIRELVPLVASRLRRAEQIESQSRTVADSSGGFPVIPPEGLATRRELDAVHAVVRELEARVAELDKVIAVLKDRAGMAD